MSCIPKVRFVLYEHDYENFSPVAVAVRKIWRERPRGRRAPTLGLAVRQKRRDKPRRLAERKAQYIPRRNPDSFPVTRVRRKLEVWGRGQNICELPYMVFQLRSFLTAHGRLAINIGKQRSAAQAVLKEHARAQGCFCSVDAQYIATICGRWPTDRI